MFVFPLARIILFWERIHVYYVIQMQDALLVLVLVRFVQNVQILLIIWIKMEIAVLHALDNIPSMIQSIWNVSKVAQIHFSWIMAIVLDATQDLKWKIPPIMYVKPLALRVILLILRIEFVVDAIKHAYLVLIDTQKIVLVANRQAH